MPFSIRRLPSRSASQLLSLVLLGAFLSGCATPYQRQGFFIAGYSEKQLAENIFQVSFHGNQNTGRERASDFALLRSAEVTTENGFRFFIVVEWVKDSSTTSRHSDTMYGYGNTADGSARTSTYGDQTFVIQEPSSTNTILCFKEKPDVIGLIFDADFVKKSLRQKYGITD
jgi:hypothetical protein